MNSRQKLGLFAIGAFIGLELWFLSNGDYRSALSGAVSFGVCFVLAVATRGEK